MPKLPKIRHERYAQARANGATHRDAYIESGGKGNPKKAGIYGYQLVKRNPDLGARIKELEAGKFEKAQETRLFTQQRVRDLSEEHLDRCMQKQPVLDNKGEPAGEYRYEAGQVTQMLKLVGQDVGLFNPIRKSQHGGLDPLEGKSDSEIRELVLASAEKLGLTVAEDGTGSEDSDGGLVPSGKSVRSLH